jgi:hypothetical protein
MTVIPAPACAGAGSSGNQERLKTEDLAFLDAGSLPGMTVSGIMTQSPLRGMTFWILAYE